MILSLLTQIIATALAGFWIFMMSWCIWAAILAYSQFKPSKPVDRNNLPPVSILRPLRGVDMNLEENLTACFSIDYPKFEVILSVAEENDPAVPIARKVLQRFPGVDSTLIIGEEIINVNPKINNLIRGYRKAKYDCVWICDSNVLVDNDTLLIAGEQLRNPQVGLVHHAPEGINSHALGAQLEEMFLNTAHAKIYLVINWLAVDSCVMGKSTIFRKSDLAKAGGLEAFGKYMAEDNMIGQSLMKLGLKHHLSCKSARQPLLDASIAEYLLRRSRWTRIRAYSLPGVTLLEPLSESVLCGLTGAFGFYYLFNVPYWPFFFVHMILWFVSDAFLVHNLSRKSVKLPRFFLAWILRELSAIPIYLYAVFGNNIVNWRGRKYLLRMGGTVEPIAKSGKAKPSFFVYDLIFSALLLVLPITKATPTTKGTVKIN